MSNVRAITTAIAAVSVTYTKEVGGTVTPTAYDISALPPSVPAANLPVRLLGAVRGSSSASFVYETAGTTAASVEHSISELALIEMVGLSRMQDEWCDTMRYMDALLDALQANRSIYTRSEIVGISCQREVIEWPAQSGEFYFGCMSTFNIKQLQ